MEISKYYRTDYDYSKLDLMNGYPKKVPVNQGSSTAYWLNPTTLFKRKQQDGNCTARWSSDYGAHHFRYEEEAGSFDDLAEVVCYRLAKNLGTRTITTNNGEQKEVPVVDCAEYDLAVYEDETSYPQRGCTTKTIAPNGEVLVKGSDLLAVLADPTKPYSKVENSLQNHMKALQSYETRMGGRVVLDKNIGVDLLINSYFCYKVSNSDNHSNNIIYIQRTLEDGTKMLSVAPMIDNGAAWEMCSPCVGPHKNIVENNTNENGEFELTSSPYTHIAFHLNVGDLNGHNKTLDDQELSYQYDMAAHALSNPELYNAIYQIEQNFNLEQVFSELDTQYHLKWPDNMQAVMTATSNYNGELMARATADYFCYTAFRACVGEVDCENPSDLYLAFREQMANLPLQPSIEGYIDTFTQIATENQIPVDPEQLGSLTFLPESSQTLNEDCAQ